LATTERVKALPSGTVVTGLGWVSIVGAATLEPLLLDEEELLELLLEELELELLDELELELLEELELEELDEPPAASVVALTEADRLEALPAAS